jgi:protease stability complex PrcB-like protein
MPSAAPGLGRNASLLLATALLGFSGIWVTYHYTFGNDRLRTLPWRDLTSAVGPLRFPHGTTRLLPGPKTFALYLRERGFRGRPPTIDFDRRDAILVALGPRSTTTYELQVVSVVEERRRVVVTLREHTPTLGEPVTVRTVYPFRLITIPKTHKRKFVHIEGRP